jgi:adenylate cyclase
MEGGRVAARDVVCTVLFSDLENFTPVSERLGPARLMDWLNRYMDIMAGLVLEHGGIVDDYFGDAIMADFGVPLERTTELEYARDARNAVDCALAMRAAIAELNKRNAEQDLPPVRMRVGIATGEMVVGFLGTSQRMKYTTIGDTVNTAARLESYGKELPPMEPVEGPCRILVADSTAQRLGDDYRIQSVGALALKGKSELVNVYTVLSKEV